MRRAERFFLIATLAFGGVFAAVTPPFQAPDEPVHFYRAYAVSEGSLTAARRDGRSGEMLPTSLWTLVEIFADLPAHPELRVAPGALAAARRIELEPGERIFLDFPNAAVLTPVAYLPPAAAIALGRGLGAPPLALLYLARLANLLTAAALTWAAVGQLPAYRWLAAALALTPMAVFLRASASVDALIPSLAFLLAAVVARLAFARAERIGWRDVALLTVTAAALCLTKPAYAPLALAPLAIGAARLPRRRAAAVSLYAAAVAGAFALAVVNARAVDTLMRPDAGVDPDRQVARVLAEPLRFLAIAAGDYVRHAPRYAAEMIGRLGWLDTPLPLPLLAAYLAVLLALSAFDAGPEVAVGGWQRAVFAVAAAATMLLISGSLYALYTRVGVDRVAGIQGRYFLPVAPFATWIVHGRRWAGAVPAGRLGTAAALFCALSLAVSLAVLIRRYYL